MSQATDTYTDPADPRNGRPEVDEVGIVLTYRGGVVNPPQWTADWYGVDIMSGRALERASFPTLEEAVVYASPKTDRLLVNNNGTFTYLKGAELERE